MKRFNNSAARTTTTENIDAPPSDDPPANDDRRVEARPLPAYVLTETMYQSYLAMALALDASDIAALPGYLRLRLDWMARVQASAWADQDEMARVYDTPQPIDAAYLDDFGFRIAFARRVNTARAMSAPGAQGGPLSDVSDAALWSELLTHRNTLCDALALREGDVDAQAAIAACRAGQSRDKVMHACRVLLRLFDNAALAAWVGNLPRNERRALARLGELTPEWERRAADKARGAATDVSPEELMRRAFALAAEPVARVLRVGRYLVAKQPHRKKDYRGFSSPRPRTRAKRVAPPAGPINVPT